MTLREQFEKENTGECVTIYIQGRWRFNPKYVEWLESKLQSVAEPVADSATGELKRECSTCLFKDELPMPDNACGPCSKKPDYTNWQPITTDNKLINKLEPMYFDDPAKEPKPESVITPYLINWPDVLVRIIDFAQWYSGMSRDKVRSAYVRFLKEVVERDVELKPEPLEKFEQLKETVTNCNDLMLEAGKYLDTQLAIDPGTNPIKLMSDFTTLIAKDFAKFAMKQGIHLTIDELFEERYNKHS